MTDDDLDDDTRSKVTPLDLEQPILELRDGIGALMALGPHFAIGDAGVLWIAGKLQEAVERLLEDWRLLVPKTSVDAGSEPESSS